MVEVDKKTANLVLNLQCHTGENIRQYLFRLLESFWENEADNKYGMTGESDWRYDLYDPLRKAGLIPEWEDGYGIGYRTKTDKHPEDQELADALITAAIHLLKSR
jgi:hypothetical protein